MATGQQIYDLGVRHIGEKYSLGALVPKNVKDYSGPWDCAEFTSWLVFQLTGKLYGCANNLGDPGGADAYSGFWARDVDKVGKRIPIQDATMIPGAFLLRIAGKDIVGHIVVSNGHGGTVEAHSTKSGVITSTASGRRWDCGILVPWIEYEMGTVAPPLKKPGKIYRWTSPMMFGDVVKKIQAALSIKPDGYYGPKTFNAVKAFQRNSNLIADGEVGPLTAAKLGLTL